MNKNIKKIIALTLIISAFSTVSTVKSNTSFNIMTKPVYASSYSPSTGELKSLEIESSNDDSLDLRDGYNGDSVKLNDDKEYYAKITDDSESVKINAVAKGDDYVVRIFTSDNPDAKGYNPGDEILLGKGDNTLYVRTYESLSAYRNAKDKQNNVGICEEEYKINVRKTTGSSYEDASQDSIYLNNIELSKGTISFLKQRTSYDVKVDSSVSEIKITAKPDDENDRVRIDGSLVDESDSYRKTISLDDGKNEIKIKVTDNKDNQRTYTLNITRGNASSNQDKIYLDDITSSEGEIDFSKDENSYNIDLDESVSKVTIGAHPEDDGYLVTINGDEVKSSDDYEKKISLSKGENTVKVVVEDEINNLKRTYTLTINRGNSKDSGDSEDNGDTTGKKSQWVETSDGWKYYDENGNILKNSWLFDKDQNVYCYLNNNGLRQTGWYKDKGKWYLLNDKGAMLTGWQTKDGKWYMLDKTNGDMKAGWYKEETVADANSSNTAKSEKWYYLNDDGSMKTGWLQEGSKWYYFNSDGTMQKGWLINSNSKYYLNEDGTMATGDKTIDGKTYKFTTSGALVI